MEIVVRYEGGDLVTDGEVSRSWNHHLGDSWTASIVKTDANGKAKFKEVSKRVPLLVSTLSSAFSIVGHYYPGFAGSIKARDANNHRIWQRIDFKDSNCCPTESTISLHETEGEAKDEYFTFGTVVPND